MDHKNRHGMKYLKMAWVVLFVLIFAASLVSAERKITLTAVGDCVISRRLSTQQEEKFLELIELIRSADAAYGNMEGTLHDKKGYPAPKGGDMNIMANNHSMDYMYEGLFATQANLDRVGIIHAGTGKNLEEAAAPAYFDSKSGRIALINCVSTPYGAPEWALASATRGDVIGRPGINPLRLTMTYQVTKEDFETLKRIIGSMMPQGLGWKPPEGDEFNFLRMGTIHDHGQQEYLEKFAHACIDAGADCLFGSGPDVFFEYIGSYFGDKEIFWTSVVPWMVFSDGRVQEIKLYPITLNPGTDRADPLGRPFLADAEMGKKIISRMGRFSKKYGTKMAFKDGIGVVALNQEKE